MKNKYLTKLLCITMISVMVLSSGQIAAMASLNDMVHPPMETTVPEEGEEADEEPVPDSDENPDVTPPAEETPAPAPPEEGEDTPTPPAEETPTPAPPEEGGETPTPTPPAEEKPSIPELNSTAEEKVAWIIAQLEKLGEVTLESEEILVNVRSVYESLTEEQKLLVTNYDILVQAEDAFTRLKEKEQGVELEEVITPEEEFVNETPESALEGTPVYVTNAALNLHAGKEFYLDSLKETYHLEFSEDFADVMTEIEQEYKTANKLQDDWDKNNCLTTSSKDQFLVRNWQDILAVYIYRQNKASVTDYKLDRNSKTALAEIFAQMNPIVRDKKVITKVSYGNLHVNDYIKLQNIAKEDRKILQKYMETDCKLLCATVTGAKGFVRQSVGENVSEERVNVITVAYSLVGKIGYFWGGKSGTLGWDDSWGQPMQVGSEGSPTTGSLRAYGLDCSGFVSWAFNNGYMDISMESQVGNGTTDQWNNALTIREDEAQPGDLVFQRGPEAGSDNHVGIICGQTDNGDWIVVHCSSGKNGVTVGEAYSASFRYIRRPACYPTAEEVTAMEETTKESGFAAVETQEVNDWKKLLEK